MVCKHCQRELKPKPQPKKKKSSSTGIILLLIVVACVVLWGIGSGGSGGGSNPARPTSAPAVYNVKYRVTGTTSRASLTY
ncbi:MAG: hypothetical protein GY832_36730 [Chloroflexi bacterium]|nr:hypothetical protein [Chloroflexota bacterium]